MQLMNTTALSHRFAVVIPAYNEEKTIYDIASQALKYTPNVIVVDDASSDQTATMAQKTSAKVITLNENSGKAAALRIGFNYATSLEGMELIITLDGDGQHNPDDIPLLIKAYARYPNRLIIAARLRNRTQAPKARLLANKLADFWIGWAASNRLLDTQSGFRAYPVSYLQNVKTHYDKTKGFVFESEALIQAARLGYQFVFVPINSVYPEQRRASHFRPFYDIMQITRMVAVHLIGRALNLPGLVCYFTSKPTVYGSETNK